VIKAVIAVPPVRDFYFTPHRASALGARSLVRELERTGWNTSLLNLPLRGKPRTVPLPEELDYLKHFILQNETGPLSWFTAYHQFGPSFAEAAEMIFTEKPDALFISSFAWAYAGESLKLAGAAARMMPDLPIIMGGHGPTSLPDYFLNAPHPVNPGRPLFTQVIAGEVEGYGELLSSGISGERYLDLRTSERIGELQPIAGEAIRRAGRRSISITLTRGCPLKCRFCSNHICHGRQFRSSPPDQWEKEIIRVVENGSEPAGPFHLNIEDDNILFLKEDFFRFLEGLKSRYPEITFSAENGLDYMLLEREDIHKLKKLGFTHLNLSLAVLSGVSRRMEYRDGNPEKLTGLIYQCREEGLALTTHFICGLRGDRSEDIVKTLKFLDRLPTQIGISNFYPVPGLEGFKDKKLFLNRLPGLTLGSSVYPWTEALSSAQMITAFRLARWSNFRKKVEVKNERHLESPGMSGGGIIERELELYRTIRTTHRLHSLVRRRSDRRKESKRNWEIIPLSRLDSSMIEDYFS